MSAAATAVSRAPGASCYGRADEYADFRYTAKSTSRNCAGLQFVHRGDKGTTSGDLYQKGLCKDPARGGRAHRFD